MSSLTKKILYWTPRVVTILFALFLSIFAADVFEGNYGFFETILALFMHLIPVFIILIVLAVSWKNEWIGGVLYISLALIYIFASIGKFHFSVFWVIPLPLIVVGVLFIIGWFKRTEIRPK